jgi:hypothetical protein
MNPTEFEIDLRYITREEAFSYLLSLRGRERWNLHRTQAWFDHCARIRRHPSSHIPSAANEQPAPAELGRQCR